VSTSSTGGTVTTDGADTIHTFTSDGTFTAVLAAASTHVRSPSGGATFSGGLAIL
jgi:hypothetical protein